MAKEKVSEQARSRLRKLSGDSIIALNDIRRTIKLEAGVTDVVRSMIDEERDIVLAMNSADNDLATKHAYAKGRVGGLTLLLHMIKGSGDELERREKE